MFALAALVSLWGCSAQVPVLASGWRPSPPRQTAVDFEAYPHLGVQLTVRGIEAPQDAVSATAFLVRELRAESGFETVSAGDSRAADLILYVEVTVTELAPSRYGATALFATVDRAGNVIDRGEPCDSSTSPAGAIEDTLDLLVKHYRP